MTARTILGVELIEIGNIRGRAPTLGLIRLAWKTRITTRQQKDSEYAGK
jgi:hypothetical protein